MAIQVHFADDWQSQPTFAISQYDRMALRTMGFSNTEMTAHGFRGTASTLLNSSGKWSKDAIERQLCHIEINKVRSAHCHMDFLYMNNMQN